MEDKIEITYQKPIFYRQVLASVIDFIFFAILFVGIFIGARAIVTNSGQYVEMNNKLISYRLDSGLYVKTNNEIKDFITFLNEDNVVSYGNKNKMCVTTINDFASFIGRISGEESKDKILKDYDVFRLNEKLMFDGQSYFIKEDNVVTRNPACTATEDKYFNNVYSPYIDTNCNGFMLTEIPEYYNINKTMSYLVIFLEIPVSVFLSSIIIFCLPPLFFKRERYTIGKFLYRVGAVGPNYLSVSYKRMLVRCLIFEFGIVMLSLFTFGLPLIISFTMMAFSKYSQSFPNMMAGIFEVDVSHDKIYFSLEEIEYQVFNTHKKGIDFKLPENTD